MSNFKFLNNLLGWISFLAAFIVYELTLETNVSLWDCGEFIAASYKLMVVHPPGAPFFLMLGRLFSMLAPSPDYVAIMVNTMSAMASAFAVMFTFWIVTHYAKKLMSVDGQLSADKFPVVLGAGLVGAMSLTFMDSFWFSAVEAEVYALSSFFTMLTFWCALKWERSHSKYADRWLILIALLIGIAIGTHLLNLLVIPAIAFIYYFKKYENHTLKGGIVVFALGLVALLTIQNIIIPGVPKLMAISDLFFVNTLGFGFGTGSMFAIILIIAAVVYGIFHTYNTGKRNLNLIVLCLGYILIGYSSYAMVVIRSSANPPIDMNNPADPFNLLSYINREQYGDRPLLYGPYFNGEIIQVKDGKAIYTKDENQYIKVGYRQEYEHEKDYYTFFPRMGDYQKDGSPQGYRYWSGMGDIQGQISRLENEIRSNPDKPELQGQLQALIKQKPTFGQNLKFFFSYQLNYMYWRYFMWNFAGRQNDQQGHHHSRYMDGNWISGIGFIDAMRLGPQSKLPDAWASNHAKNKYYLLPFLLGLLGIVFQYTKKQKDFIVNLIFFLFTGILIIVFLNQPPYEPRERDYAMVGSFQVFCIWIGLGVLFVAEKLRKFFGEKLAGLSASLICLLAVPTIMGAQGWDDHDRSGRRVGIDFAINYLESCAPNAILFTNGDNDTYPLWYAQNVEGIRTDIRIINMSLLPTDWYSSILLDQVYDSEPLPLTLTKSDLRAGNNDVIRFYDNGRIDQSKYYPLGEITEFVRSKDPAKLARDNQGKPINYLPVKNFRIAVDKNSVIQNQVVPMNDTSKIIDELRMTFSKNYMHKGDLVFFDLLATNAARGWERPIYFTTTTGRGAYYGLEKYFQLEGLTYRLVPIESRVERGMPTRMAEDILYDNIMNKFKWSQMKEIDNFFLDDKAQLVPQNLQTVCVQFANELITKASLMEKELEMIITPPPGAPEAPEARRPYLEQKIKTNRERAIALLDMIFIEVPESVILMRNSPKVFAIRAYKELNEDDKALKHLQELFDRNLQVAEYFAQFQNNRRYTQYAFETHQEAVSYLKQCEMLAEEWGNTDLKAKYEVEAQKHIDIVTAMQNNINF
jgi:hypothetical protein